MKDTEAPGTSLQNINPVVVADAKIGAPLIVPTPIPPLNGISNAVEIETPWDPLFELLRDDVDSHSPEDFKAQAQRMTDLLHARIPLPGSVMHALLDISITNIKQLPNVVPIGRSENEAGERGSIVVVGDTHGQFHDFVEIMHRAGAPSNENRYIVNGDIVDRGDMSVEILAVLLTYRLACKASVTILRGNHETTLMNSVYGFEEEVLKKFNGDKVLLAKFRSLFDILPFGAVIESKAFVVHGGLGKTTKDLTIEELNQLDRIRGGRELWDLLWSGTYIYCFTFELLNFV
jgi:predicted phosphodiesterase